MKKILIYCAALFLSAAALNARSKSIDVYSLPDAVRHFIECYFPDNHILRATQDDDLIYPSYDVELEDGISLEFYNDGTLEKISSKAGVSREFIPVPILEFVKVRYPGAYFVEYKMDKKHFEVTLSNRIELKFNNQFNLIEVDD